MLVVSLIFHVDEVEWVIPIVIQDKKDLDDIRLHILKLKLSTCYTLRRRDNN